MTTLRLFAIIAIFASSAFGWTQPYTRSRAFTNLHQEKEEKDTDTEWGVSYIGGDPCGSKYNNDPFDNKPSKPGFPDDMKARIEAMAEQKRRESEMKTEDDN